MVVLFALLIGTAFLVSLPATRALVASETLVAGPVVAVLLFVVWRGGLLG